MMRTFHKLFLALVLALSPMVLGCAGNGAIHTVNDPFTGVSQVFVLHTDWGFTGVGMTAAQGKFQMTVMVYQNGITDLAGSKGDKGEFKLGDQIVTLESDSAAKPVASNVGASVFTQWQRTFVVTPEVAAQMAKMPLSAVKVWIGERTFQIALSNGQQEKFLGNMIVLTGGEPAK